MQTKFDHPALILAGLGAASGILGSYALGFGYGESPHPGIYMVLSGYWFGFVVGFGVWKWGRQSWIAAAAAVVGTWLAWEMAVNLALQIEAHWLEWTVVSDGFKSYISGFAAGAVGAFLTWAAAAALTPVLRQASIAATLVSIGALFGLLLPFTSHFDNPTVLLLPWQVAVAAVIGYRLAPAKSLVVTDDRLIQAS